LQEMASALYLRKKSDGLTEAQKTKIFSVLEGITEKTEIDRKFDLMMENLSTSTTEKVVVVEEEESAVEGDGQTEVEPKVINESNENPFDSFVNQYVTTLKENKI